MREYLGEYVKKIDKKIKDKKITEQDIENHLTKIQFFPARTLNTLISNSILWSIRLSFSYNIIQNLVILNNSISRFNYFNFLCQTLLLLRKSCPVSIQTI